MRLGRSDGSRGCGDVTRVVALAPAAFAARTVRTQRECTPPLVGEGGESMRYWNGWIAGAVLMLGSPVAAQETSRQQGHSAGGHGSSHMKEGGAGGSSAMHQHMKKAAKEMSSMKMSGDVDRDFVMAMRKHHQDGIAMAQIALEHGKDEKAREMARRIVDEQQKDLGEFDAWLAEHGGAPKNAAQGRTPPKTR
jgi:hypothetical protein